MASFSSLDLGSSGLGLGGADGWVRKQLRQKRLCLPCSVLNSEHFPQITAPHGLQRCLRLVMELKLSPQLLQPCFSLSRLVLEDPLLGPGCRDEGCG